MTAAIQSYPELDPSFTKEREFAFLNDLCQAVEAHDVDLFSEKTFQWDRMSPLDSVSLS